MNSNNIVEKLQQIEEQLSLSKPIFTMVEFCKYTGLSKSTAYKLTSSRKIPFSQPNGKLIFFRKTDIDNWLLSNPRKSMEILELEASNLVFNNPRERYQR